MSCVGGEGGGCHLPPEASKTAPGIDRLSAQQEGMLDDPTREVVTGQHTVFAPSFSHTSPQGGLGNILAMFLEKKEWDFVNKCHTILECQPKSLSQKLFPNSF